MNRRKFFGAALGVSSLSLPVAEFDQNNEQAYVNMVHCPSCSMTMFHTRNDDGEPRIECGSPGCRLFGVRYKPPTVELQRTEEK